jgi:hypothetical protein
MPEKNYGMVLLQLLTRPRPCRGHLSGSPCLLQGVENPKQTHDTGLLLFPERPKPASQDGECSLVLVTQSAPRPKSHSMILSEAKADRREYGTRRFLFPFTRTGREGSHTNVRAFQCCTNRSRPTPS